MTPPHAEPPADPASPPASSESSAALSLSRRAFLLGTALLASCRAAPPLRSNLFAQPSPSQTPSAQVRRPSGPVPRNPDAPYSSKFSPSNGVTFTRVLTAGNFIAMTFDDGPHPAHTPRLLDILRARNIKATFFVIGRNVDLYPHIARRTVAEGHEIANHTYTHRLLSKLSDSEIRQDLTRCRDAVSRACGYQMRVMRPPYGGLLPRQRVMVHAEFGYPTILWSVDPLDWKRPGPGVVTSRILRGTNPGGIVLAHDIHAQTIDAMPATLDGLLRKGFHFVTVSQLLAMQSSAANPTSPAAPALTTL